MDRKKTLEIQVLPFEKIARLGKEQRIKRILSLIENNKIIILDSRLDPEEETELIKKTMENINKRFPGIEIGVLGIDKTTNKFRAFIEKIFFGHRRGLTIIGPANIIKDIKQDPEKLILFMQMK